MMVQSEKRKSESGNENWLPDMDLNHDKQIQSLLCYRYTIGQAGAFGKLEILSVQSSRESAVGQFNIYATPLPRGEGETAPALEQIQARSVGSRFTHHVL